MAREVFLIVAVNFNLNQETPQYVSAAPP